MTSAFSWQNSIFALLHSAFQGQICLLLQVFLDFLLLQPYAQARGGSWEEPPTPEARGGGREEQPHVQGVVAAWVQEGLEELFHIQGRRAGGEEIHLVQGKEQRLCFAGGAERYPTSEVREIQVIQ